jgi:biotin carboxylase
MPRVLLLAATTGYQTRAFEDAAQRLGFDLVYATDRCHVLDDPWQDGAIPIRFFDESAAVAAILRAAERSPFDGVIAVGDRPTRIAARVTESLGLPGHTPDGAAAAGNKQQTRDRLRLARLPVPWFMDADASADPRELASTLRFPCIVKPLALSGSRGVMRADNDAELVAALYRLRALLQSPDIRSERSPDHERVMVEGFIPGREYAVEGILTAGRLKVLAIFDKPEPLDGPFFEETIYVTPSSASTEVQRLIILTIERAVRAIGLRHGPIHAECRVNDEGVYVLEVAARPIGGLCARALRFVAGGVTISLEELILRHSVGRSVEEWQRERRASGVMMIPIPRRGILRRVSGLDHARAVAGIEDLQITAKIDHRLLPVPEGASYLGFMFARADRPAEVERALHCAHRCLAFTIDPEVRVLQSFYG